MKKYTVRVEGRNYLVKSLDDNKEEKLGFFTARFVEANNKKEAENIALNLIREELHDKIINKRDNPPMLYVEDIDEVSSFGDNIVPGKGFTWYPEED
jgi:hypothetical protein